MSSSKSLLVCCALALASTASAQTPEDEWGGLPTSTPQQQPQPTPPPPDVPLPPPPPADTTRFAPLPSVPTTPQGPLRPRAEVLAKVKSAQERNTISMMGAQSLGGQLRRAEMVAMGFPLFTIRALIGLVDRVDVGLGFDSYYFLMNEPRLLARFTVLQGENAALAFTLEGGYAFFAQRASRESRGARWLTGRRNINISPAVVASYQGSAPRAARLFIEGRYLLALDTEPFATDPLSGVPPSVVPGHNVSFRGGAELPLSAKTSFVMIFNFDIHGRANDSVVMPGAMLGVVTSL